MFKHFLVLSAVIVVMLAGAAGAKEVTETIYFVGPTEPLASGPGSFTVQVDGEQFDKIWSLTVGVSIEQFTGFPDNSFRITAATPIGPFADATCLIENPSKQPSRVTMELPSVHTYTTTTFLQRQPILRITFSYPEEAFGSFSLKSTDGVTQAVRVFIGIPGTVPVDGVPGAFRIDDTQAPSPTPMTWATVPQPAPDTLAVTMVATTATDTQNDVEYYFEETSGNPGGDDSGWQDSPAYTDTGVMPLTAYAYRVKARDKSPNQNETQWSTTESVTTPEDTFPPEPNPATWQTVPQALTDQLGIAMAANPVEDVSGVEYYFEETSGNPGGDDSGWQDSPTYTDTGLLPQTAYTYRVKARDRSPNLNETDWASEQSATSVSDIFPPQPNPPTWAIAPAASGFVIAMASQVLEDSSGVEYYFEETSGNPGGDDSGWQDSPSYTDTGLKPGTTYTYRVKARDKMPVPNEGLVSEEASATTRPPGEVPMLISYQGKLNQAGKPLNGSVTIAFSFYGSAEGGEALYSELQTVQVVNAIFNVLIGSVEPLTKDIFDHPVLYLGVKVADDAEMTPRKRVASTAFAIRAVAAGTADLAYWSETSDRAEEAMAQISALQQQVQALQALLAGVTRDGNTITCSGVNLQIVNGSGSTETANGLGNLIIGYNEFEAGFDHRTGSHNVVVGSYHTYTSYGGLVAGSDNTVSGPYCTASGGSENVASGEKASISGGFRNTASNFHSSVSGGLDGKSVGLFSSISGGWKNEAQGDRSSVSGGCLNIASGELSSVSGGYQNRPDGAYSSVSGGRANTASGVCSAISGGRYNTAGGEYSSVAGGGGESSSLGNKAFGHYTAILGGQENIAGDVDLADHGLALRSTISGGRLNNTTDVWASVSGGIGNTAGYGASVSGGYHNTASGTTSSVSGGEYNTASGDSASVSGGEANTAEAESASVSGGDHNKASGESASVSGGTYGTASAWHASVTGGNYNTASGNSSSVSGGSHNTAGRSFSSVSGGESKAAQGSVLWRAGDLWLNATGQWPICTELEIVGAGGAP